MMDINMTLLFVVFTQGVLTESNNILTTQQLHTALCVETIAHRYFTPGSPLVISLPGMGQTGIHRPFLGILQHRDHLQMVNFLLENLNERTTWTIQIFQPEGDEIIDTSVLHHSYILFVWLDMEVTLNRTLGDQVEILKYSTSWNPRGRFVVVVSGHSSEPPQLLASLICAMLWQVASIANIVVLIPNQIAYRSLKTVTSLQTAEFDTLNLYTWFPYQSGRCGQLEDVTLLDEWMLEHNGRLSNEVDLFPIKVPNDLVGCPIRVATYGIDPYVILTDNYTRNDGTTVYRLGGLSVEILSLVCEKMNLKTVFSPPSINLELESAITQLSDLQAGITDVLTGIIILSAAAVNPTYDATVTYTYGYVKMIVPCPKRIPGMEKIMTTFSLSVWLMMVLVLLLTAALFWWAGNGPYHSVLKESHSYKSVSHCFYSVWAVLMGVSVPKQPTTSNLRVLFLLYVCYCFAMSTVFQALFVSYLVEPAHEKKIKTFDELQDSDVIYGYHPIVDLFLFTAEFPALQKFSENKKLKEECTEVRKCVQRTITKNDMASFTYPEFSTYVASELGIADESTVICYLEENLISAGLTMLLKKGNFFLDRINVLIRRCLEAGFLEKYWSELQHGAHVRSMDKLTDNLVRDVEPEEVNGRIWGEKEMSYHSEKDEYDNM
ncbi:uncharacterized protein LOC117283066 [Cryptotermes secundus]|nr:uncharacterized protein LOC117283066 [Cryptotermes secundus]